MVMLPSILILIDMNEKESVRSLNSCDKVFLRCYGSVEIIHSASLCDISLSQLATTSCSRFTSIYNLLVDTPIKCFNEFLIQCVHKILSFSRLWYQFPCLILGQSQPCNFLLVPHFQISI